MFLQSEKCDETKPVLAGVISNSLGINCSKDIKSTLNPASVPFVPGTIGPGKSGGDISHIAIQPPKEHDVSSTTNTFCNGSDVNTASGNASKPGLASQGSSKKGTSSSNVPTGSQTDYDDLKSPISLVHESALKRNHTVHFDIVRETGPPHMRIFITKCIMGEFVTQGEGNGKKVKMAYQYSCPYIFND